MRGVFGDFGSGGSDCVVGFTKAWVRWEEGCVKRVRVIFI